MTTASRSWATRASLRQKIAGTTVRCVYIRRLVTIRRKTFLWPWKTKYPMAKSGLPWRYKRKGSQQMDFARGVAEMAAAIKEGRHVPAVAADSRCTSWK